VVFFLILLVIMVPLTLIAYNPTTVQLDLRSLLHTNRKSYSCQSNATVGMLHWCPEVPEIAFGINLLRHSVCMVP